MLMKMQFFYQEGFLVSKTDIQLLSSSDTKMNVWNSFKRACEQSNKQAVSYTKFIDLWKQFHPNIVVAKPMSDLRFTCQQNTSKLLWAANLPEAEKSECVKAQQEHLNSVQTERELYREVCEEAKCNLEAVEDQTDLDEQHEACSVSTTMHYSFDFAQQVHYPSNPMQPGPIYFKTPRKCAIFGIMCEAIPQQVNYLIDEASDVGKGANTTISYLHHYFAHHGLGETSVHLHADNCTGQNKLVFASLMDGLIARRFNWFLKTPLLCFFLSFFRMHCCIILWHALNHKSCLTL